MLKQVLSLSGAASFSTLTESFSSSFLCALAPPAGIGSREHGLLQILLSVVTSLVTFLNGGLNSSILPSNSLIFSGSNAVSKKNIYLTHPEYAASMISCDLVCVSSEFNCDSEPMLKSLIVAFFVPLNAVSVLLLNVKQY